MGAALGVGATDEAQTNGTAPPRLHTPPRAIDTRTQISSRLALPQSLNQSYSTRIARGARTYRRHRAAPAGGSPARTRGDVRSDPRRPRARARRARSRPGSSSPAARGRAQARVPGLQGRRVDRLVADGWYRRHKRARVTRVALYGSTPIAGGTAREALQAYYVQRRAHTRSIAICRDGASPPPARTRAHPGVPAHVTALRASWSGTKAAARIAPGAQSCPPSTHEAHPRAIICDLSRTLAHKPRQMLGLYSSELLGLGQPQSAPAPVASVLIDAQSWTVNRARDGSDRCLPAAADYKSSAATRPIGAFHLARLVHATGVRRQVHHSPAPSPGRRSGRCDTSGGCTCVPSHVHAAESAWSVRREPERVGSEWTRWAIQCAEAMKAGLADPPRNVIGAAAGHGCENGVEVPSVF
ncbi:hypothetical protein WOLCODRAFT_167229 [Wolfiporia cocos MD-104 SS10]|uniref:Uncharacterized protein n=1 Tax=Wolfiporia cocos (strain MD-104) TaxID=742152 RepID=A0A2H3JLS0_WOLCO|nr:hypothetical protein WOLCODRAFT_167229 [Wolfiporia cocos MD-104 SS10]